MSQTAGGDEDIDDFIQQLQQAANNRDLEDYLGFFKAELRELEKAQLESMWTVLKAERISLYKAYSRVTEGNGIRLFLRAKYENPYSVIIEMWKLELVYGAENSGLQIESKEVDGDIQTLYKIVLPSDSIAKVREVKIEHKDILITFEEANVFF